MIEAIGRTPLVRLKRLPSPEAANVWVKLEAGNPTGSMKDRMGLAIVRGAIARGALEPGGTMVDYTGGSTGSSIAFVCAALGFRAHFVSSDAFDATKLATMRAYGAELDLLPAEGRMITPDLFQRCFARVEELKCRPGYVWVDQFNNPDNRSAYHAMAEETLTTLGRPPAAFVAAVGTGGCFSGNAEVLKARSSDTLCVAVEPATSRPLAGLTVAGGHRLEGMGVGYITPLTRTDLIDEAVGVTDEEATAMARRLAHEEGIFSGYSTGANVAAALRLAERLGPGADVVTVQCDSGFRYLGGDLYRF
ncbi:MAG TPA: cysteine synthase family protein [Fimbriimonadaceae bacterium]|nr:cysteine synthase family protein [Fimbriimonadaceae bacterium]